MKTPQELFNPFTAMLAAQSRGKRLIKVSDLKSLRLFPPSHEPVKGFLSKCTALIANLLQGPSDMLLAGVYVCTFQQLLQAGAVKGLTV